MRGGARSPSAAGGAPGCAYARGAAGRPAARGHLTGQPGTRDGRWGRAEGGLPRGASPGPQPRAWGPQVQQERGARPGTAALPGLGPRAREARAQRLPEPGQRRRNRYPEGGASLGRGKTPALLGALRPALPSASGSWGPSPGRGDGARRPQHPHKGRTGAGPRTRGGGPQAAPGAGAHPNLGAGAGGAEPPPGAAFRRRRRAALGCGLGRVRPPRPLYLEPLRVRRRARRSGPARPVAHSLPVARGAARRARGGARAPRGGGALCVPSPPRPPPRPERVSQPPRSASGRPRGGVALARRAQRLSVRALIFTLARAPRIREAGPAIGAGRSRLYLLFN